MHSNNFNISTYFNRINYTGPAGADTATLHALMRHQLFPFPLRIWTCRRVKLSRWRQTISPIRC